VEQLNRFWLEKRMLKVLKALAHEYLDLSLGDLLGRIVTCIPFEISRPLTWKTPGDCPA